MHCEEKYMDGVLVGTYYFDDQWKKHDHNGCAAITRFHDDGKTILLIKHYEHGWENGQIEGQPSQEIFGENGKPQLIKFIFNRQLHNPYGPAFIEFYSNGNKHYESYHLNDKYHRIDGPAVIRYNLDGSISGEEWYIDNNVLSKDDWEKEVAKLNPSSSSSVVTNAIAAKDYPCPHCQRSVNTSEKECWCCGGKLQ